MKDYDVIIAGAGIAGLICANYLARDTDLRVLLIEKNYIAGGLTSGFFKKGYYFEAGTNAISVPETFINLLNDLQPGLGNDILIERYNFIYHDQLIELERPEEFLEKFSIIYPDHKDELKIFFKKIIKYVSFLKKIITINDLFKIFFCNIFYRIGALLKTLPVIFMNVPNLIKLFLYDESTYVNKIFSDTTKDPGRFFVRMSAYDNMKLLIYIGMWNDFFSGVGFPKNGFLEIVEKLLRMFKENGGEVLLSHEVTKFHIEKNTVVGVETNKGEMFRSKYVVSNIDLKKMIFNVVGKEYFKEDFIKRLKNAEVSESIIILYLGIKIKEEEMKKYIPHNGHVILISENEKDPESFEEYIENYALQISVPLYMDKNPSKHDHLGLTIYIPVFSDFGISWNDLEENEYKAFKKRISDIIIRRIEEHLIPNIKERIEVAELATPKTIEKWSGTTGGSTCGFSWDREKSFLRTSSLTKTFIETSIYNLYQTGAFSTQNGGVAISAITGKLTANKIIKKNK